MRVVAIKTAPRANRLDWTEIGISRSHSGLTIRPPKRLSRSVRLEIIAPANTHLELSTPFGNVDVHGPDGRVEAGNVRGSVVIADRRAIAGLLLEAGKSCSCYLPT